MTILSRLSEVTRKQLKYQAILLGFAASTYILALLLAKDSISTFISIGNLTVRPGEVSWLGISPDETWGEITPSLCLVISLVTFGFMYSGAKRMNVHYFEGVRRYWGWIILFSFLNAFSEEIIFRLVLVGTLLPFVSPNTAILISALLFGLAHWKGAPGGVPGVIVSGLLGWMLAKSMVDTGGLLICLIIHVLQDLLIFPVVLQASDSGR